MRLYHRSEVFWNWTVILVLIGAVVFVTFCSDQITAAPKVCETPERCAQGLDEGELAPFKGMLLSTPLAIDQSTKAHDCAEVVEIEVGEVKETLQLKLDAEIQYRAVDNRASAMREDLLKKRVEEAQKLAERAWWEDPRLWLGVGVIVGVGMTIGATYAGVEIVKSNQ